MDDAVARASVQIMKRDRARFSGDERDAAPAGRTKTAFDSYIGCYGTYELNAADKTLTYRIQGSSSPTAEGRLSFAPTRSRGKRMTLRTHPINVGGEHAVGVQVWQRVE
jgi:hypothetical protein